MLFKYSRLNSMFGYGSMGVSLCLVSYLISQEVPKIIASVKSIPTVPTKPKPDEESKSQIKIQDNNHTKNPNVQVTYQNNPRKVIVKVGSGNSWWNFWKAITSVFSSIQIQPTFEV